MGHVRDKGHERLVASPRDRTLAHMRRLLATAVAGASIGGCCNEDGNPVVCDPLPPPVSCSSGTRPEKLFHDAMEARGAWRNKNGRMLIEVIVTVGGARGASVSIDDAPTVRDARLVSSQLVGGNYVILIEPTKGKEPTLVVPVSCTGTHLSIELAVTAPLPAKENATVLVEPRTR